MTMRLELPIVERIESRVEQTPIDWRKVGIFLLTALPLVLGWLAGVLFLVVRLMFAAASVGFELATKKDKPRGSG